MQVSNLVKVLENKINSATTAEQVFVLSQAIYKLNLGAVKTVTTYTNLLSIFPAKGEVYLVEDEVALYYGMNTLWYPIISQAQLGLWSWGSNTSGQLGNLDATNRSSPVSVVGGFADWTGVSAGSTHSLGIRANGSAWAWGSNPQGQLGDNTTTARSSPVSVVGGFTDWTGIGAGLNHSLGIRANGTAWAWGSNNSGRLGDNSTTARSSPVSVVGAFSDWTGVSAGGFHSLGIRANGSLWAWGSNNSGRLGDNTTTARSSPVSVVGGFADWTGVSAGGSHSLGIRANGSAWAWGYNGQGRLGDNTTTARSSPVSVVGGFSDWTAVSGGGSRSLGIRANGTAWAWGSNLWGQLGTGDVVSRSSPTSVVGGFSDWTGGSAGDNHSLGTRANGTAWAWGSNLQGQLGDNTTISRSSPVSVVGGFTNWIQPSGGGFHSLALRNQ